MALPDLQGALWAWVQGLPPWQSDLLRRLAILDVVKEADLAEATQIFSGSFSQIQSRQDQRVHSWRAKRCATGRILIHFPAAATPESSAYDHVETRVRS